MNLSEGNSNRELVSSVTPVASPLYNRRCHSKVGSSDKLVPHKPLTKFVLDDTSSGDGKMPIQQKDNIKNLSLVEDTRAELKILQPDGIETTAVTSDVTAKSTLSSGSGQLNYRHRLEGEYDFIHQQEMNNFTPADDGKREPKPTNTHVGSLCSFGLNEGIKEAITESFEGVIKSEIDRGVSSSHTCVSELGKSNDLVNQPVSDLHKNLIKDGSTHEQVPLVVSAASALHKRRRSTTIRSSDQPPPHQPSTKIVSDNRSINGGKTYGEEKLNELTPVGEKKTNLKVNLSDRMERASVPSDVTTKCTLSTGSVPSNYNQKSDRVGDDKTDSKPNETPTESSEGGDQPETDRHVRSRRTFVPGPDQLNGLVELPLDNNTHMSKDDGEIIHPLELMYSITNMPVNG